MGKCDLSIELESPTAVFQSGQKVRGHVHINADTDVRCRSLDVYAGWRTHGMGNVTGETGPKLTLFSGELVAGASQRLPFELETLGWPVTYHGFQLSVEHFIETTASIPWATDPKVSLPIHVLPSGPGSVEIEPPRSPSKALQGFVFVFISAFLTIFAVSFLGPQPWVLIGAPSLVLLVALMLMLTFKWLPQLYVGKVEFDLQPRRLAPGQWLDGYFSLCPSRTIHPQFIHFRLTATEVCISGAGTNQKTHRYELFDRLIVLADQPLLPADEATRFEIRTRLPPVAAYSIKLTHNELNWVGRIHVGIPGLVDWKDEIFLTVIPPREVAVAATLAPGIQAPQFIADDRCDPRTDEGVQSAEESITFAETVEHIRSVHTDPDQVELLVEAVAGLPLGLVARIDRRLLRPGVEDVFITADEQVVWAEHEEPPLALSLYVPPHLGNELEHASGTLWAGRGEIVGWDPRGGRLQVRVVT